MLFHEIRDNYGSASRNSSHTMNQYVCISEVVVYKVKCRVEKVIYSLSMLVIEVNTEAPYLRRHIFNFFFRSNTQNGTYLHVLHFLDVARHVDASQAEAVLPVDGLYDPRRYGHQLFDIHYIKYNHVSEY